MDAKNAGGLSLALLPIQYSHCLRVSGTENLRLVRSNIFFAGLLFSGESRVWIDFDFGFMKSKCRWSDIADIKQLKMAETVDEPAPEHHPFAVKKLSDLPLRLEQVLGVYRNLP